MNILILGVAGFLQQTKLNIGEIALKVGVNNQSNFNRVFKSELNLSPSE